MTAVKKTPEVSPIAPTSNTIEGKSLEIQGTITASTPSSLTFKEVLEKFSVGNQHVRYFFNIEKRIEEILDFQANYGDQPLTMVVSCGSIPNRAEIVFQNQDTIKYFLEMAVEKYKLMKDGHEVELMNMFA